MASVNASPATPATQETLITVKVLIDGTNRKFKFPLKDLTASLFTAKLRDLLQVPVHSSLVLERWSDSSGSFLALSNSNPSSYKQLYRAAKAKLRLRIRAAIMPPSSETSSTNQPSTMPEVASEQKINTNEMTTTVAAPPAQTVTPKASFPPMCERPAPPVTCRPSALPKPTGKLVSIPVTSSRDNDSNRIELPSRERASSPKVDEAAETTVLPTLFKVYCNNCHTTMDNTHFHCSICDGGDYDLCQKCVNAGVTCPGEGHWLIKRVTVNGKMITSTTERIAPKPRRTTPASPPQEMPGTFKTEAPSDLAPRRTRTCNACVQGLPENMMITCTVCDDFDLCIPCHLAHKHGHHPGHTLEMIDTPVKPSRDVAKLLSPGRNIKHNATCDGCNVPIRGIRHKCLNCPDWDYCNNCIATASHAHPGHRFASLYDPISNLRVNNATHYGVYCDGPLCKGRSHQACIRGIRYKCAVCNDTDFCANCEAHPSTGHNPSHPLIKFMTQVATVSVTTIEETPQGESCTFGDQRPPRTSSAVASQPNTSPYKKMSQSVAKGPSTAATSASNASTAELDAHFISDTMVDGTVLPPSTAFLQSWTLKNPGPKAWPAGCNVRRIGGDGMLNLDPNHPSSVQDLALAQETNSTTSTIAPGEEYSFVVTMRTPPQEGRCMSYWRLKAPDGTPFGHKLWCDVEVKNIINPMPPTSFVRGAPPKYEFRGPNGGGALADYQMQLMLLEAQNRKRLMMARQGSPQAPSQAPSQGPADGPKMMRLADISPIAVPPPATQDRSIPLETTFRQMTSDKPITEVLKSARDSEKTVSEQNTESSSMVFPKLEKESPSSSTHESSALPTDCALPSSLPNSNPVAEVVEPKVDPDFADDDTCELGVEYDHDDEEADEEEEDDEDDESFLTDEEYDILDASDEEFLSGRHSS